MPLKKGDFIEIEYTGKTDDGTVFDTTDDAVAKKAELGTAHTKYGPVIICLGEQHVLKGVDTALEGKEVGEHSFDVQPEEAFGKKSAKMIQLVPTAKFRKEKITPVPGMQVNVDNTFGIVRTVTGGRTLVDFNHPLSGKTLSYVVKVNKIVTDDAEKIKAYLTVQTNLDDITVSLTEGKATITTPTQLPVEIHDVLKKKLTALVPSVKTFLFSEKKTEQTK